MRSIVMNYCGQDLFEHYAYFIQEDFKYEGIKDLVNAKVLKAFDRGYEDDSRIREIRVMLKDGDKYTEIHNFYNNIPYFGKEKNTETVKSFIDIIDLSIDCHYKIMIYLLED